jgi:hypothetical protein
MNIFIHKFFALFIFAAAMLTLSATNLRANPGDTTWVMTYNEEYHNWATVHQDTFQLPATNTSYNKILMYYTIGCPAAGCDPWDRLGWVVVYNDADSTSYEIARVITPYNIVGGSYPGTCTWIIDVTDYAMLLHDEVSFGSYIESWIGDARGWLVTIEFAFIEGEPEYYPYKITNLWQYSHAVFGDPSDPIEDKLIPKDILIDADADKVKLKVMTTGHGQGNTDNAAEFSQKWHSVKVGEDSVFHILWRTDCAANPCSPQGGTWQYNRAGWCPGQSVIPWENDITTSLIAGQYVTLDYNIMPYENFCRPNNPNCVNGVTCADCNYNYNGHTEPHYTIQSHLIYYSTDPPVSVKHAGNEIPEEYSLMQNYPNPFNPETKIVFNLKIESKVYLTVFDILGQKIARLVNGNLTAGIHQTNFDASALNSGVYLYRIDATGIDGSSFTSVKKMILTK